MAISYKAGDIAKNLGMTNKKVVELLEQDKFDVSKKHNTVLTDQEYNAFLEKHTKEVMVENLDSFLEVKKPAPVKTEAKKPAPVKTEAKKPAPVKTEAKKPAPVKTEAKKPAPVKIEAKKPAPVKIEAKKPQPPAKQQAQRTDKNNTVVKLSSIGTDNKSGNAVAPKEVHHVDTKAASVNLEKYNERYEKIAPSTQLSNDNVQKKQKLKQRSAQRGRMRKTTKPRISEAEKLQRIQEMNKRKRPLSVTLPEELSVGQLASILKVTGSEVVKKLMGLGVMATMTQTIDYDTAELVSIEFGAKVEKEVVVTIEERVIEEVQDLDENMESRSPVVVVMGHVDHGKTSLLDAIREKNVTESEAGGITQHIGAYKVKVGDSSITFLDTPGHEAFTSMRARGAEVTDIAILVVAADDGIMPQTIESINHAKAAGVNIIVAINKMDKPGANPDKIKQELTEYELVAEEWGGETICVPVSAIKGENIDTLLEMVQLVADVKELKANPNRLAKGVVIEAKLDKGRGPVATVLVQTGTLKTGDVIIAGSSIGRVRVMTDENGKILDSAGPSTPVEITGLSVAPSAGDEFNAVKDERLARTLVEDRKHKAKEEVFNAYQKVTLDNLFSQIEDGDMKELPLIVKADVQGSVEAVKQSLEKLSNEEVRVRVIHSAVGAITESDVMLAGASKAIIIGFNVRPEPQAQLTANNDEIELRMYRIIYDAIDDVKSAMKGMLDAKIREVENGKAEVRSIFKLSTVGTIAGCYVTEGKMLRQSQIRIVRDGIVIVEDEISSLKRFKDDAKEVAKSYECGISLEKYNDIKVGDILESFTLEEYRD